MKNLKKFSMAIVAVVLVVGFSAFKVMESKQPERFIYELNQDETIGPRMLGPNSSCDEPFGLFCSVELSEAKPNDVETLDDAKDEGIHVETLYWQ